MVNKARLPNLYSAIGKLYAEVCDFDEALRLLENKLDEGFQTTAMRESYYRALRGRGESKARLNASLRELQSHTRRRSGSIVMDVLASA
jgi:hypothetical protein